MGFPLHARFAHPGAGWKIDQERAAELLTVGRVYTVRTLDVGRYASTLTLYEVPGETFNTVLFEAAPAPFDPFDDEAEEVTSVNDPATEAEHAAADQDRDAEASQEEIYEADGGDTMHDGSHY